MSGAGAATTNLDPSTMKNLKLAIVAASWHTRVMDGLVAGAQRAAEQAGIEDVALVRVPGTFELPVAAARLVESYDAVVALGVVIRGGTPHFDYVCEAATSGLTRVAVDSKTPVGFGVLTCDNEQQALDRAGLADSSEDKGFEATAAALETAVVLKQL
ncbi:6,7-dimethyl-8-ribityllumazine synthase [Rothia aerolata]|uniref:6,7-dimethyl-8-ribityllumazine synthase n=1 Tax=Rothia aerolata TaxID=1812262 RepID=A0A917INA2_9MICC|nr:6,7-dimethyl-8-ribityllumazine synthase [Rothia aerolata]GGH56908.1 6,7-dimethyl-8-ribityllumazine synthase [Rothia aerolata]